jgi:hypothetical protein
MIAAYDTVVINNYELQVMMVGARPLCRRFGAVRTGCCPREGSAVAQALCRKVYSDYYVLVYIWQ